MNQENFNILLKHLKEHEGFRSTCYKDHLGNWTIGYGRRIDGDKGISQEEAETLLLSDIKQSQDLLGLKIKLPDNIDEIRLSALTAMVFQLGIGTFLKFKKMIKAIEEGDWDTAAKEALDSRWETQTPRRAHEVADILKTGRWPN
jgi:lysozyme